MPTFYEVDSTRASAREIWWASKRNPLAFAIVSLRSWLRVRTPMASDDAIVDSTIPFVVESLSEELLRHFEPLAAQLNALGFVDPVYHCISGLESDTHIYWATFRHESGKHLARIHNRYWDRLAKRERGLYPIFITEFIDGTFLFSSTEREAAVAPAAILMNGKPGATTSDLWKAHLQKVEKFSQTKMIQGVHTHAEMIEESERLHILQRDFHLGRGYFRQRTEQENLAVEMVKSRVAEARAQGANNPDVLGEIARLEEQKPQVSQAILLLVVSLVAFIAIGAAQWKWETTLWLIPILFFHELGHWVAMKIFGYRNMRMFFIPFFGAAVSGQNRTIPAWKKAIVSLAGPLPGIVLGAFLCGVGILTNTRSVRFCALMFIIVNVFNLVPVMPLDGGRFLYLTLFCRNRWLDILFRIAAIGGLIALAAFGFGRIIIYIAISLAVGLPVAFKIGRVIDRFKSEPLPPPLPGEEHIPITTADTLATAVKDALPQARNRLVAQHVLNIYETLNARPPSVPATAGLLALYGGGIALSLFCVYATIISTRGSFGNFLSVLRAEPHLTVSPATVQLWRGPAAEPSRYFVVTTAKSARQARSEFDEAMRTLPTTATALLFGESVIVKLPSDNQSDIQKCFSRFSSQSTNTFIASNNTVRVALDFIAPNTSVASNLEQDLIVFFRAHVKHLVPPWNPIYDSTAFASKREARKVWYRIEMQVLLALGTNVISELVKAQNNTNLSSLERTNQLDAIRKHALPVKDKARAVLAAEYAGTPFLPLVEYNGQLSHLDLTNRSERTIVFSNLAEMIGCDQSLAVGEAAVDGSVIRDRSTIKITSMGVAAPEINLPEIVQWLANKGCTSIRYRLIQNDGDD